MRVVKRIVLSDQDAESPRSRSRSSSEKEEMSLADRIASKREREGERRNFCQKKKVAQK